MAGLGACGTCVDVGADTEEAGDGWEKLYAGDGAEGAGCVAKAGRAGGAGPAGRGGTGPVDCGMELITAIIASAVNPALRPTRKRNEALSANSARDATNTP
jgi:hypothetical protein